MKFHIFISSQDPTKERTLFEVKGYISVFFVLCFRYVRMGIVNATLLLSVEGMPLKHLHGFEVGTYNSEYIADIFKIVQARQTNPMRCVYSSGSPNRDVYRSRRVSAMFWRAEIAFPDGTHTAICSVQTKRVTEHLLSHNLSVLLDHFFTHTSRALIR